LPGVAQMFALLSEADVRQMHGPPEGQSESVKQSSYQHPAVQAKPPNGKQRPSGPWVHSESFVQPIATPGG
jgi:hypothetical protein